jgi:hypothetical protein
MGSSCCLCVSLRYVFLFLRGLYRIKGKQASSTFENVLLSMLQLPYTSGGYLLHPQPEDAPRRWNGVTTLRVP